MAIPRADREGHRFALLDGMDEDDALLLRTRMSRVLEALRSWPMTRQDMGAMICSAYRRPDDAVSPYDTIRTFFAADGWVAECVDRTIGRSFVMRNHLHDDLFHLSDEGRRSQDVSIAADMSAHLNRPMTGLDVEGNIAEWRRLTTDAAHAAMAVMTSMDMAAFGFVMGIVNDSEGASRRNRVNAIIPTGRDDPSDEILRGVEDRVGQMIPSVMKMEMRREKEVTTYLVVPRSMKDVSMRTGVLFDAASWIGPIEVMRWLSRLDAEADPRQNDDAGPGERNMQNATNGRQATC